MAVGASLATAFVRIRPDTAGFGRDLDAQVRRETDAGRTGEKIGQDLGKGISRGVSPLITSAVALGPALLPVLAASTAGAIGLGGALVSGGAALGVFGAVAKASFKDIQDNAKLAKKGTEQLTTPIGRATTAYQGLTAAWERFVARNQPATFRIFGAGFSILTQAIPKLQPLFNVAADAVARLEGQLGHFVTGGGMGRLVRFLSTNAAPALESFRQTFTNLFTGIGALSPLFSRFAAGVEVGMVQLSARFAAWAKNGGPGGGFQRFINYVVANGPVVASTLHELASAAVNISQGLAPLGPVSLSFVGAMARLIAVLPPGVITGIASGFVAVQLALKGAAAASDLFNKSFGRTPIGLVSIALTALIGVFVQHAQAVAASRARTEEYASTLDKTSLAITNNTRLVAANNLEQAGAFRAAQTLGLGLSTVTAAATGNQAALAQVNATVALVHGRYQEFIGTGQAMEKGLGDQETAASLLTKILGGTNSEVANAIAKQARLNSATKPTTVAIISQTQAAVNAKRAMEQLATQLLKLAGINLSVAQTDIAFRDSLTSLSQSVHTNGRSLDINTVKGRQNRSAVLDSISAALQHADAVGKQTGSQVRAQAAFQNSIPAIEAQARKLGLNKRQVDALVRSVGGLRPKTVDVAVVVRGTSIALSGGRASVVTGSGTRAIRQTGFASGGIMPGYTPGRDVHDFYSPTAGHLRLSGGEPVLRPEAGKVLGRGWVDGINSSARAGGTSGVQRFLGGFAGGGVILNRPGSSTASIGGAVNSAVNRAAIAAAIAAVTALIKSGGLTPAASSAPFAGGGAVSRWLPVVLSVLSALHQPSSLSGAVLRRIAFESGGNPNAINLTDSNAKAGYPSRGLVQTIPGTFNAYAGPYASRGITDPFANIYAGMNYALHRYGSIGAVDPLVRHAGYDSGGYLRPGVTVAVNRTGRPERVLNADQTRAYDGGGPVRLHPDDIRALGQEMGHVVLRGVASNNLQVGRTAELYVRGG